jgi:hypothetical protein
LAQQADRCRFISIFLGLVIWAVWFTADDRYRHPPSINRSTEYGFDVIGPSLADVIGLAVGLAVFIFAVGIWIGMRVPSWPSMRAEREYGPFEPGRVTRRAP